MEKLIILSVIIVLQFSIFNFQSSIVNAQPTIQWQNTIGGSSTDELYSIQQTSDGGYVLGGYSLSDSTGDKTENSQGSNDYWVVKLDSLGVTQWQNTIGGSESDQLNSIQQTSDGGYVLGGGSLSNISGDKTENSQGSWDYWVVKLDSSGAIQWQNTIGGSSIDRLFSIQQTSDGGYVLGGSSGSDSTGDKNENVQGGFDYWVVKLNASGAIQWQNTIGGSSNDYLRFIQQTSDGGYVLGGYSLSGSSGDKTENSHGSWDYWVVKLDSSGTIKWQNTIGGSAFDRLFSIQQTSDGGYVLSGYSGSPISGDKTENSQGGWDYWVVKLCMPDITNTNQSICAGDSALIFGIYQSTAGTYYDTSTNIYGCDSIISTMLTIATYNITNPAIAICNEDSVSIYGISRSVAATYYDSSITTNGCDSIHSTVLTVNTTYSTTDPSITICNGDSISIYGTFRSVATTYYDSLTTINGCDSVHSTVLILNPTYNINDTAFSICDGDSISIYGIFRSSAGTYYDSSTTTTGCDSIHSTVLTFSLPTLNLGADTMICNGCSITLDAGAGFTSYDWSTGATTQTIIVDAAGTYAVQVTDTNGCTVTDSIIIIIATGINLQSSISTVQLQVHPNPNTGEFIVTFKITEEQHINLKVFNIKGELIYDENLYPVRSSLSNGVNEFKGSYYKQIDLSSYAKGIYNLQLTTKKGIISKKIILE